MKKVILPVVVVVLLLGAFWFEWRGINKQPDELPEVSSKPEEAPQASRVVPEKEAALISKSDEEEFPRVITEAINGRTGRTIHMGVRQYAWDPSTLTVKKGELVRLIIHNADVMHGIVIPDLGIMEGDIPPEGAVIEFSPNKVGTFEFFCSVYCGEGHMEMRGKIVVE